MGCCSSREAQADAPDAPSLPQTRSANDAGITSTTAINGRPSATNSRHQNTRSLAPDQSASNVSSPRPSSIGQNDPGRSLSERSNLPLVAPKAWTSTERLWTRSQLQKERSDFFDSQVSGIPEIWGALKEVTELLRKGDLVEAQAILDASEITLPHGRLEKGAYDKTGKLYRLPNYIVSDPLNIRHDDDGETIIGDDTLTKKIEVEGDATAEEDLADKGKDSEKGALQVRCRLSDRGGPDTVVLLAKTQPVSTLIRRLRSEASLSLAPSARIRMAYYGKILIESQTLQEQGWQEGHVIQALISNFASP